MKVKISAKGYTNIILALNMNLFVAPEDQERFENLRGTTQFADVLQIGWESAENEISPFSKAMGEKISYFADDRISPEQVGFATGVFRSQFLRDYASPTYSLNKELVSFPLELSDNFQFRALFMRAWKAWKIFVRPTVTGMLIIRLTRNYTSPRELIKISEDVLNLDEPLDVQSAQIWLARKKEDLREKPEEFEKDKLPVTAFLDWLGRDLSDKSELQYLPVKWKIAMEVASLFIKAIGEISLPNIPPIHLTRYIPRLSIPLQDSYIIFHLDDIFADESIVIKENYNNATLKEQTAKLSEVKSKKQISVLPEDLNRSPLIKRALLNLLDGVILEHNTVDKGQKLNIDLRYFPVLRWQNIDRMMENNLASWMGEICMLTTRNALIMPSRAYKKDHIYVSTTPGATLKAQYVRYWDAIERMLEFVIEIRMLVNLVERGSYKSLEEIANTFYIARENLQSGDIQMDNNLPQYPMRIRRISNLRRLAALSQNISDPSSWGRSESSILKARYLMDQFEISKLLVDIDRNINSLYSLISNVDELYLLDLAEKNNDYSVITSLGLAILLFVLAISALPSFFSYTQQIKMSESILSGLFSSNLLGIIGYLGIAFNFILILFSLPLMYYSIKYLPKILKVIQRALKNLGR